MTHIIRFWRPETAYGISRMFVTGEVSAEAQVRHLNGLGYTIIDVLPPLVGQHSLQFSERQAPASP